MIPIFLISAESSIDSATQFLFLLGQITDDTITDGPLERLGDLRRVAGMRFNFDSDQPTLLDIEVGQAADEVNNSKKMEDDSKMSSLY